MIKATTLAATVLLPVAAQANTYNFTTIMSDAIAYDINNNGEIVGTYQTSAGQFGFIDVGGAITSYTAPSAIYLSSLTGVNDNDDLSGSYQSLLGTESFIDNPTFQQIGGPNTFARDINNEDQVAGTLWINSNLSNGFVWGSDNFTMLSVPNATFTEAEGLNDLGTIVGGYALNGVQHAYIFDGTNYTTIDAPNSLYTIAFGVNNNGVVVGNYIDTINGPRQGFVLNNGVFQTVDVPGALETEIFGINDIGDIVGMYRDASGTHAFMATDPPEPVPEPSSLIILITSILVMLLGTSRRCTLDQ